MRRLDERESERLLVQEALDLAKTQEERNRVGQFATPGPLARQIADYCAELIADVPATGRMAFLEPAVGTGAFWSAWLSASNAHSDVWKGTGFELDPELAAASQRLWASSGLSVHCGDFTSQDPPASEDERVDLVIANPPYVRHHHISREEKVRLRAASERASGVRLSGLAGLYCHFVALAHQWMRHGALAAWLLPSEFLDVNYGGPLKRYLMEQVTLLRVHQFDPNETQFDDALVSSAVIVFRNERPSPDHVIDFTRGGSLFGPKNSVSKRLTDMRHSQRWTQVTRQHEAMPPGQSESAIRIADIFTIRRGLVTGGNEFFVMSEDDAAAHDLPPEVLTPILPSPRYLDVSEVRARLDGSPDLHDRRVLLDCRLSETELESHAPTAWAYLNRASDEIRNRYICKHRKPWYRQERRPPAPLLCTYLGRGSNGRRPFRFILNHSNATAANVYHLLYPLPGLQAAMEEDAGMLGKLWRHLNSVDVSMLLRESRVYGGGLHKLEPGELGQVSLAGIDPEIEWALRGGGLPQFPETEQDATYSLLESEP